MEREGGGSEIFRGLKLFPRQARAATAAVALDRPKKRRKKKAFIM